MRGRNMFAQEITRDAVTSYEVVIWEGLIANGWLVFVKVIKPNSDQRQWKLSDLCENWSLLYHFIWQFKSQLFLVVTQVKAKTPVASLQKELLELPN